jgi:hypothetical protein
MRFAKHAASHLLNARLKKPKRAIPVLRREFGAKSMRIEKKNKTKHDKTKLTRRGISQPAPSPTTLRKDCLGIKKQPPSILTTWRAGSGWATPP